MPIISRFFGIVIYMLWRERRNIYLIRENAQKTKFKLTRFISSDVLELYFDILKKDKNIRYISKGWDDPGFRVGDYFEMALSMYPENRCCKMLR